MPETLAQTPVTPESCHIADLEARLARLEQTGARMRLLVAAFTTALESAGIPAPRALHPAPEPASALGATMQATLMAATQDATPVPVLFAVRS